MSGWAAIYGGMMAQFERKKWEKKNPAIPIDIPVRWTTWESLCGGVRVDFNEHHKDIVERSRTGINTINYQGKDFKLIDTYSRVSSGRCS